MSPRIFAEAPTGVDWSGVTEAVQTQVGANWPAILGIIVFLGVIGIVWRLFRKAGVRS